LRDYSKVPKERKRVWLSGRGHRSFLCVLADCDCVLVSAADAGGRLGGRSGRNCWLAPPLWSAPEGGGRTKGPLVVLALCLLVGTGTPSPPV